MQLFPGVAMPRAHLARSPPPIPRSGPLPERLVRLCFNKVSMRPGTHLYPKHLLSQGYPPTICSPISIHPPFGSSLLVQMPAQLFPVGSGMVHVRCPNTSALGHLVRSTLRINNNFLPLFCFLFSDFPHLVLVRFLIFLIS